MNNTHTEYVNHGHGLYDVTVRENGEAILRGGMCRTSPDSYGIAGVRWMFTIQGANGARQYVGRTRDQAVYHALNDCHRWVGRIRHAGNNVTREHFTTDGDISESNLSGWYRSALPGHGVSIVGVSLDKAVTH